MKGSAMNTGSRNRSGLTVTDLTLTSVDMAEDGEVSATITLDAIPCVSIASRKGASRLEQMSIILFRKLKAEPMTLKTYKRSVTRIIAGRRRWRMDDGDE